MSTDRDELDRLAGEYVLGLLENDERDAFEIALAKDANAREALRHARERFLEFDITAPKGEAPEALWSRIDAGLDGEEVAEAPRARIYSFPVKPQRQFWQGFAAASAAAAVIALLAFGTLRTLLLPAQPQLIVVLLDAEAQPEALVEAYASQDVRVVPLQAFNVPEGKTYQVWTLPDQETGPVSLGLIERSEAITLSARGLPPPQPDQLYEITVENEGGSPTGRPTGPIVAKGFARIPQI